jgi:hypothetical protein
VSYLEALLIGIATSFNFLVIKWKLEKHRYEDAALDFAILAILASVFGGSLGGMVIATIASFIVSLYLIASPPKFLNSIDIDKDNLIEEWKKRLPK